MASSQMKSWRQPAGAPRPPPQAPYAPAAGDFPELSAAGKGGSAKRRRPSCLPKALPASPGLCQPCGLAAPLGDERYIPGGAAPRPPRVVCPDCQQFVSGAPGGLEIHALTSTPGRPWGCGFPPRNNVRDRMQTRWLEERKTIWLGNNWSCPRCGEWITRRHLSGAEEGQLHDGGHFAHHAWDQRPPHGAPPCYLACAAAFPDSPEVRLIDLWTEDRIYCPAPGCKTPWQRIDMAQHHFINQPACGVDREACELFGAALEGHPEDPRETILRLYERNYGEKLQLPQSWDDSFQLPQSWDDPLWWGVGAWGVPPEGAPREDEEPEAEAEADESPPPEQEEGEVVSCRIPRSIRRTFIEFGAPVTEEPRRRSLSPNYGRRETDLSPRAVPAPEAGTPPLPTPKAGTPPLPTPKAGTPPLSIPDEWPSWSGAPAGPIGEALRAEIGAARAQRTADAREIENLHALGRQLAEALAQFVKDRAGSSGV